MTAPATPARPRRRALTIKAATAAAVQEVETWPGEFSTDDVVGLTRGFMRVGDEIKFQEILSPGHRHKEHLDVFLRFPMREWVLVRLRKTRDDLGLRKFICYRIEGQRRRHWLKVDNLTLNTLDYLTRDRHVLIEKIGRLLDYLVAGRQRMIALGPDATFGDVKVAVFRELNQDSA
jgi:hypothetical protein